MAQTIKGKTAIVTGAGSGINLEFARLLLEKGANVVFADLSLRPEAQALVDAHQPSSTANGRRQAIFQKTDVSDWAQLEAMFTTATTHFGSVDIVCPGAGVYEPPFSNFWHPPGSPASTDAPTAGRYALLDINLTHPIRTTQLAIAHFLAQSPRPSRTANPKSIIHISSIAGQATPLAAPLYNASKHALNGFVRSLGPLEARLGIRVAAVAPGVVRTPLWTEHAEKLRALGVGDGWVTPEEVARVMVALVERDEVAAEAVVVGGGGKEDAGAGAEGGEVIAIHGGSILEVSTSHVRDVRAYDDPGPGKRVGTTVSNMGELEEEVWSALGTEGWGR